MNIQERLTAFAMLGATWVMWLLIGLSIISLAICLERAYYLIVSADNITKLKDDFVRALREGNLEEARKRLALSPSFEAVIVQAGLEVADRGAHAAEERMAGATQLARLRMERNLVFLGTVGNNAPFVGLLGTVIGVIGAFHELDNAAGQVTSGLMTQIGEALVATAIGILVAIPAVAFYNYFQRVTKARLARAGALGSDLLAHLKSASVERAGS